MKRRILSFLLILTLIISAFAGLDMSGFIAKAANIYEWGDYEYTVTYKNEVIIKTYLGNDREVTIPSDIDGMPVTEIGDYCFNGDSRLIAPGEGFENHPNARNNRRIRKVVIPSSVKVIGEYAFSDMDRLKEVVFSEGLKTIEPFAFAYCPKLEEISLPESLVDFTLLAFEQTAIEEIVLGSNVKNLELEDVEGSSVKKLICNADPLYIGRVCLVEDISVLEEIVCNGDVYCEEFERSTIKRIVCKGKANYTTALALISEGLKLCSDVNGNNIVFSSEAISTPQTYDADGFRYYLNDKSEAVITRYIGGESNVVVPSSLGGHKVTAIAPLAFSSLETDTYRYIGANDWYIDKKLLVSVALPDTIEAIGKYAFAYNLSLESINIPASVEKLSDECFFYCQSLKNLVLPDNVREIGINAFKECTALESVTINGVVTVGDSAFKWCEALESVEMKNIAKVGNHAFDGCRKLSQVTFSEKLKEIGTGAFGSCTLSGTLDLSSVTKIGADAFSYTQIKKVILNDNLERLEYGVFQSCTLLEEINFPSKLVSIGDCCFRGTGINKAVFGENLKEIGALAFDGCKELYIMELPESIEKIGSFAFDGTLIELLIIPENLSVIGYRAFGDCKDLETLYFNAKNCSVEPYMNEGTDLDLENLGEASPFYGCNIREIFLGEGISSIGGGSALYGTFENCSEIESIIIPDTVSEIGAAAFKNCSSLETAVIPGSVTQIADDAFDGCGSLTILCFENSYVHTYAQAQGIRVSTFVVAPIPNQTYTGKEIKPAVSVSFLGDKLDKNIDFGVTYANNINVGEADVTVKGKGDYKNFSNTVKFTIVTKSITSATIAPIADQAYTGSSLTPNLTVTDGSKLLKEGTDYTASYSDNRKEGIATVKITGKGNYSGSLSAEFQIAKMSGSQTFFSRIFSAISSFFIRIGAIFASIFNQ